MIASLIWRMNAIFPIYPIYDIYIYLYTHIHLEFLFRSKLPTILNEWPYSRRACTSLENRLTQFTVRFHGTIVNCYDSMPSLFPPSSTLIALSLSIPIYVDYPVESVFARNGGYRYRFRVGCGRCFIQVECQQRSVQVRFVDSSTNSIRKYKSVRYSGTSRYRADGGRSAEHRIL